MDDTPHVPSGAEALTISVVVPNKNGGGNLLKTLESILAGVPSTADVWLVDDGSTDGSSQEVGRLFPRVNVLALERSYGAAYARNRGLQAARGDLLLCVDADVVCRSGCLPRLIETLQTHDIVFPTLMSPENIPLNPRGEFNRRCCLNSAIFGIRRPALKRMDSLFDETIEIYGEDNDFFLRAHRLGLTIQHVPEAVATHPDRLLLGERHYYLTVRNAIYVWLKLRLLVSYWMPIDLWIGLFLAAQFLAALLNRGVRTGKGTSVVRYTTGSRLVLLRSYAQALAWNFRHRSHTRAKRRAFEAFLRHENSAF